MEWYKRAEAICSKFKGKLEESDIENLASKMEALNNRGLEKLINRCEHGGRKVRDAFTEVNFGYELQKYNPEPTIIKYEDTSGHEEYYRGAPDFIVEIGPITYCIQVKNLSSTERINRRNGIFNEIISYLEKLKGNYFFSLSLAEEFAQSDILDFCMFVEEILENTVIVERRYVYKSRDNSIAEIEFYKPKLGRKNIACGIIEDLNFINVTGESCGHIRRSLEKAAEVYISEANSNNINLIAVEMNNYSHRSSCFDEAVFGRYEISNNKFEEIRGRDGFFCVQPYNKTIMGILLLLPLGKEPFTNYRKKLFLNEQFVEELGLIRDLIPFDEVVCNNSWLCSYTTDNH